jgi:hypothetical protein
MAVMYKSKSDVSPKPDSFSLNITYFLNKERKVEVMVTAAMSGGVWR